MFWNSLFSYESDVLHLQHAFMYVPCVYCKHANLQGYRNSHQFILDHWELLS